MEKRAEIKKADAAQSRAKHIFFNIVLVLALALGIFSFGRSYHRMRQSVQDERAASVEQLAALITGKVSQLRGNYLGEAMQLAKTIEHSGAGSLADIAYLDSDTTLIALVGENGVYTALDGTSMVVHDPELLSRLVAGDGANTTFATVETLGDYWLFSVPLDGVRIGGVRYIGVVLAVTAETYADAATITLYDHLGESLVVAEDGTIKMRPSDPTAESSFDGYNLLKILESSSMTRDQRQALAAALAQMQEYDVTCELDGVTWIIHSVPSDGGRNIVVAVPVSLTAQSTYRGMSVTLLCAALVVVALAALFLYNFAFVLRKNQQIQLENVRAKYKSDFLDKMSHDIRTPLNAIVGMHELALQSIDDREAVRDCLVKAKKSGEYLVSVINDVLDMSRIESGRMTLSHNRFSLTELLEGVLEIESPAASEKDLSLTLETPSPIGTDFIGDGQRLRQCVMNLVNNAVKFTPSGGHVAVSCAAQPCADGRCAVRISVKDDGIGMSEEFMRNLFTPFEQERSSLVSGTGGSGLGLSIVHEFVTLMGGTVTAASRQGGGSTFVIELTLETAPKAEKAPAISDGELKAKLRGRRVLLVEDNAINRQILSMLLTNLGLSVDEAENGKIAVDIFAASAPGSCSLILMDIMMPVMGGLEAAAAIRGLSRPDAGTVPIVALSANAFEEDAKKSMEAGMQMHLAKPVDIEALKEILRNYIV
ncbi:MAG: ATP-binding protein [Oscillospiraceae bacterium]|nr:ATP-binding protein [Oscillospiraceae bacterium]